MGSQLDLARLLFSANNIIEGHELPLRRWSRFFGFVVLGFEMAQGKWNDTFGHKHISTG